MSTERLRATDVGLAAGLMLLGLVIRVHWFSGFGLADDGIFWGEVRNILVTGTILPDNQGYRFKWWLPTTVLSRLLGQTEWAMILPYLLYSLAGIGLLYVFGFRLWGRWGGVVAGLLLVVHPMDVAWSTLITNDIALSFFSGVVVYCTLRALAVPDPVARRRNWVIAGVALFLCYHSKVTGLLLVPVVAAIVATHRARVEDMRWLAWTAALLFGAGAVTSFALAGSLLGPMHAELNFQGLLLNPAAHAVRAVDLRLYPDLLFGRDHLDDFLNAFYPHALAILVLLAWPLGLRVEPALWWWFAFVFLGMEFNLQPVGGYWITGFRNVRHAHVFVYPLILLLAGYLVALRARVPRVAAACVLLLAGSAAFEAASTATKTHVAFADARAACAFLHEVRPSTVYLDDVLCTRCPYTDAEVFAKWSVTRLPPNPRQRTLLLAHAPPGYVVTGGAREPIYGGVGVVPLASELPAGRAELLHERAGQIDPRWRPEPFRIWRLNAESARGAG